MASPTGTALLLALTAVMSACNSDDGASGREPDAGTGGRSTSSGGGPASGGSPPDATGGAGATGTGGQSGGAGSSSGGSAGSSGGATGGTGASTGTGGTEADAGSDGSDPGAGGASGGAASDGGDRGADGASTGGAPGCGHDAGTDGGPRNDAGGDGGEDPGREFVYVSSFIGGLAMASLDPTGVATVLDPPKLVGTPLVGAAADPSQTFLYVAHHDRLIEWYRIGGDGRLSADPVSSIETPNTLVTMAIDPLGRFVYAASVDGQEVYSFTRDACTGELTREVDPVVIGDDTNFRSPSFIAAHPSGKFVYVSATLGLLGFTVGGKGALNPIDGSPFATTGAADGKAVFGGAIVFKPNSLLMYTSGGGLNGFSIDGDTGVPNLLSGSPFSGDIQSDPDAPNLAMDPLGEFVYSTTFSGFGVLGIRSFAIEDGGTLRERTKSPIPLFGAYSISVEPSGRFALVPQDQDPGSTLVYSIARGRTDDAGSLADGELTELGAFPFGGLQAKATYATPR